MWTDFSKKYVAFLKRTRICILLLWLGLALAALPGVRTLFDHLGMEYRAPEGTQAAQARHLFEQEFAKEPYENSVGLTLINNLVFLPAITLLMGGWLCQDQDAIKITLFLSVAPLSPEAKAWRAKARSDYVQSAYGDTVEVGFACRTAESIDTVDNAFRIFPRMVVAVPGAACQKSSGRNPSDSRPLARKSPRKRRRQGEVS